MIYCNAPPPAKEGFATMFEVSDILKLKEGVCRREVVFTMFFFGVDCDLNCLCPMFESRGILCLHTVAVLNVKRVKELPYRYILPRRKKT